MSQTPIDPADILDALRRAVHEACPAGLDAEGALGAVDIDTAAGRVTVSLGSGVAGSGSAEAVAAAIRRGLEQARGLRDLEILPCPDRRGA